MPPGPPGSGGGMGGMGGGYWRRYGYGVKATGPNVLLFCLKHVFKKSNK